VERLERKVFSLSQPSESLDWRWRNEWTTVSTDVAELRQTIAAS